MRGAERHDSSRFSRTRSLAVNVWLSTIQIHHARTAGRCSRSLALITPASLGTFLTCRRPRPSPAMPSAPDAGRCRTWRSLQPRSGCRPQQWLKGSTNYFVFAPRRSEPSAFANGPREPNPRLPVERSGSCRCRGAGGQERGIVGATMTASQSPMRRSLQRVFRHYGGVAPAILGTSNARAEARLKVE